MNVLSLFDGKSSGYTALELAGIPVDAYYSAEIDKYAIKVSDAIHPNQTRLGSVTEWRDWDIDWSSIDLILGGFPCQAWSVAGKQLGDKDERGMLFWTMLDIMKQVRHYNPKAQFLIENVKMKKEFEEYITHHMTNAVGDVYKTLINSALVSAQNRNRYYWTSFTVSQPDDRGIIIDDVIDYNENTPNSDAWHNWWKDKGDFQIGKKYSAVLNNGTTQKAITMTARQYASWNGNFLIIQSSRGKNTRGVRALNGKTPTLSSCSWQNNNHLGGAKLLRKLTPRECFRLQTVPEHYIDKILDCGVSNSALYKIAGNGWTDEVIAHIFRCMKTKAAN